MGGGVLLSVVLLIGLAFIPANISSKKGYSFGGFYAFGFFFFLPALIVAAVLEDRIEAAEREDGLRNEIDRLRQDINTRPSSGTSGNGLLQESIDPVCRQCGRVNEADTKFCVKCGTMLAHALSQKEPICPKCGAKVTPGGDFCGSCGWNLAEKEPAAVLVTEVDGEVRCPVCGAPQKSDRSGCFKCGAKFECRS